MSVLCRRVLNLVWNHCEYVLWHMLVSFGYLWLLYAESVKVLIKELLLIVQCSVTLYLQNLVPGFAVKVVST